ncbi:unnamed protein product [Urochloa decumbens]|uniref:F-box domain-containing protein n=1 Tax=Urochloa decumbens TaxID=240449 RepID=A0ABC9F2X0_9POAL
MVSSSSSRAPVAMVDRLSSLSDALLHAIMSFLPVRQAVQTCVLSRRWEDLWCTMPCLRIDQQEFSTAASGARDDLESDRESIHFEEFVNSLLMFHKAPSLDLFQFNVTENYAFEVVKRWFRRVFKCCPAVVLISSSADSRFYGLPRLGSSSHCLRRLHLIEIALDKGFTQHLSSACPVLEDLALGRCHLDSPEITSYTLKSLIVIDCTTYYGNVLTITTPAVVYFNLSITVVGWNWDGVLVDEMPALVEAVVCLNSQYRSRSPEGPCKLLCSLVNASKLELSGFETLSILHEESDTFPTFSNLRTLLLDGCELSDDFEILGCFLNGAPSLEKLTLQYCMFPQSSRKRTRTEHLQRMSTKCQDALTFQCPNLKLTEIKYKENDVHQLFELLSCIWRNLKKTTIVLTKG